MVVVVAAVCMTLLLGIAALVIDLGNARWQRRELVTAVDAAALAGGEALAAGELEDAAEQACRDAFASNHVGGEDAPNCDADLVRGIVEASVDRTVDYSLAQIFAGSDNDSVDLSASSTAMVGVPERVDGLVPLAFCIDDMDPELRSGTRHEEFDDLLVGNLPVEFDFSWDGEGQIDDCHYGGDNEDGPWAFVKFDHPPRWAQWIRDGFLGDPPVGSLPVRLPVEPMADLSPVEVESVAAELMALGGRQSIVALYDVACTGPFDVHCPFDQTGLADRIQVVGFALAEFSDVEVNSDPDPMISRMHVEFRPWNVVRGTCCAAAGSLFDSGETQFRVMRICDVDHAVGPNCSSG